MYGQGFEVFFLEYLNAKLKVLALVYGDYDEMFCPETWLSSRNIECACDLTGADFCVKTYPFRSPNAKHDRFQRVHLCIG